MSGTLVGKVTTQHGIYSPLERLPLYVLVAFVNYVSVLDILYAVSAYLELNWTIIFCLTVVLVSWHLARLQIHKRYNNILYSLFVYIHFNYK